MRSALTLLKAAGGTLASAVSSKQGKRKNGKVSSRGALQLVTLLSADEAIRRFTQAGSPPGGRGDVQTHACLRACTCSGRRQLYDRF